VELYCHFYICLHGMSSVKFYLHLVLYNSWKTNKLKKCNMFEGKHAISEWEAGDSPHYFWWTLCVLGLLYSKQNET